MNKEMEHLLNQKVVEVLEDELVFEDGTVVSFHPYETYVELPSSTEK